MINFARVVDVHPEAHAVDVVVMADGRRLSGVQVLSGFAGGDFGSFCMGVPTETGFDAATTRKRDVFAAVAWVDGNPFVLGFFFPQASGMLFEDKERAVTRFPSDVYTSVDGEGNVEIHHPSGAFVRFGTSPEHEDLSGKDFNKRWKINRNTDKQVHIHIEQAGGVASIDIAPNGETVIKAPLVRVDAPATVLTGRLTVNGSIKAGGDIGTDGDVIADGGSISLIEHKHGGVQSGAAQTAKGDGGAGMPAGDN